MGGAFSQGGKKFAVQISLLLNFCVRHNKVKFFTSVICYLLSHYVDAFKCEMKRSYFLYCFATIIPYNYKAFRNKAIRHILITICHMWCVANG